MRPVELAHCPPFHIGLAEVRPATREVVWPDARRVLEPRVMQVLVALAEANGETLSRGDLNDLCWEGVTVSEHAMNRVISRLRGLARDTGAFQIETINKVGYRLEPVEPPDGLRSAARRVSPTLPRRTVIAGGGLAVAALAGVAWWRTRDEARQSREVDALIDHAWDSLRRQRADELDAAISSLRLVVERRPANARAWGMLALAYAWGAQYAPPAEAGHAAERARDAIARATELDPGSELAEAAAVWLVPIVGNWAKVEQACRTALARRPGSALFLDRLTDVLLQVGRFHDALPVSANLQSRDLFSPTCWRLRALTLHDNGRIEEAAQTIRQGLRLYPRHQVVWFANLNFLIETGRLVEASSFLGDRSGHPIDVGEDSLAINDRVLQALTTRSAGDIEAAMRAMGDGVARRIFPAPQAIAFAVGFERLDDAYRLADGYFFGPARGGVQSTHVLFRRVTAPLRADGRFAALTSGLGLDRYWQVSGVARPV